METRKHKRVASGVPGDKCIICQDRTEWDDLGGYGHLFIDARKEHLAERHTVVKTELHIWQNTENSFDRKCEHCGHDKAYPLHRDFDAYDDMVKEYNERNEQDKKMTKAQWLARSSDNVYPEVKAKKKRRISIETWFAGYCGFVIGGGVMAFVATGTGWGA